MRASTRQSLCALFVVAILTGGLEAQTVIEDGMIVPRSAVNSAIDPTKTVIKITVFRPANSVEEKKEE